LRRSRPCAKRKICRIKTRRRKEYDVFLEIDDDDEAEDIYLYEDDLDDDDDDGPY
jgi:hypothetical protein